MKSFLKKIGVFLSAKMLRRSDATSGGRGVMISGSRPTMIVSVWWRVWLQRQISGSRMIMKQAI